MPATCRLAGRRLRGSALRASSGPTSATRAALDRALRASTARRGHASGGRKPCRPLDRRPGRLHPDQRRRHLHACWRRRAPTGRELAGGGASDASASFTSRPTRCSARSGATGLFTEDTPYDPRSPYSASKAASDHLVRAWRHTYGLPVLVTNCSNNYGPYQFPEKLIPLMIINALQRRAAAGLRRRRERPRLAVRRGPCRRARRWSSSAGRAGETYMIGGGAERTQHRGRARRSATLVDELRARRRAAARAS